MTEKTIRNKEVIDRFFLAINVLIEKKWIFGLVGFTNTYKINRPNLLRARDNPNARFDLYFIWILVNHYNIRAEWLFTGEGNMFQSENITAPTIFKIAGKRGRPSKPKVHTVKRKRGRPKKSH